MPTSAAGNKAALLWRVARRVAWRLAWRVAPRLSRQPAPGLALRKRRTAGFTLIELLVVVALIAIASSAAVLSLRAGPSAALERDAQRLAAVLEAARAQARASDVRVLWLPQAEGFVLRGLPNAPAPTLQAWLWPETRVRSPAVVVLGPEPLIGPQRIELYAASQPEQRLWVLSDGLRPFGVHTQASGATP